MRLFTAIPIPEQVKVQLAKIMQGRLPIAYVNMTQLHITLNFFDELADDEVELIQQNFQSILQGQAKVKIEFMDLIKFHQQIHLRVKPTGELLKLQSTLETKFKQLGFNFQERNYYPHVKLGTMHMDKVMNKTRKLENFPNKELAQLNFQAEQVILYKSELLLHHAKHTPLLIYQLT